MFASVFILLPISFCLSFYLFAPAFCPLCSDCLLLSSCLVLSFLLCLCGFFFPIGCTDKKKGRNFLRPLFVCCECSKSCTVVEKLRCRCFGFFQFVGLVCPTNAGRIRRLARSHFDFLRHYVDITYNCPAFLK